MSEEDNIETTNTTLTKKKKRRQEQEENNVRDVIKENEKDEARKKTIRMK